MRNGVGKSPEEAGKLRKTAIVLSCLAFWTVPGFVFGWSGKVVAVHDGDTISVMRFGSVEKVRLFGIDCPEPSQDFSTRATQFTALFAFGKVARILPVDRDDYGRLVAWVSVDGKSLNRELVRAGLAWWYRRYAEDDLELMDLEAEARKNKIGLWSQPNPVPPWKFRRNTLRERSIE